MARLQYPEENGRALTRRGFTAVMAGATVMFGFPRIAEAAMESAAPGGEPSVRQGRLFEPTLWFSVDGDGGTVVNIMRAEMGQHVGTALARILADELEVDCNKVSITHVDTVRQPAPGDWPSRFADTISDRMLVDAA